MLKVVLLLALLMVPDPVVSLIIYVTQHSHDPCPHNYDKCTTLSDFILPTENTSLIFSNGYHSLDHNLTISDLSSFILSIENNRNMKPRLGCQPFVRMSFSSLASVQINGLHLSGCVEMEIRNVTKFELISVNSHGVLSEQASALIAHQSNVSLIESTFTHFRGSIWALPSTVTKHQPSLTHASVGGVMIIVSSEVHILNCVFQSNTADGGGALYIEPSSNVTIKNTLFTNHSTSFGGVILVDGGNISINDSSFVDNTLFNSNPRKITKGGVIQAFISQIAIHYSNFSSNTAHYGAVIISEESDIELRRSNFINNSAIRCGGVGYFSECVIVICQSFFEKNIAKKKSGGVLNVDKSHLTINNSFFLSNEAKGFGGVGVIWRSNTSISNSTFYGNKAHIGGALLLDQGSSLYMTELALFENNAASWGVVTILQSTGYINGTILFKFNSGSLLSINSDVTIFASDRAVFEFNHPDNSITNFTGIREGGGITSIHSAITIKGHCTFTNNTALNGGGLLATSSRIEIYDKFTVSENIATDTGGGMYLYHSDVSVHVHSNISISSNQAYHRGGGIHLVSSSVIAVERFYIMKKLFGHVYIISNEAKLGGGVCMEESSKLYITTENRALSFRDNEAELGGAIYVSDETNNGTCTSSENNVTPTSDSDCFFQSTAFTKKVLIEDLVSFSDNTAKWSGSILYGGLLDRCTINLFDGKGYLKVMYSSQPNFVDNLLNFTSSSAVRLCFCKDNNSEVDCSFQPDAVNVKRGEDFNLHIAAVDHVNHTLSNVTIHGYLTHKDGRLGKGMKSQVTTSLKCTTLTYRAYTALDLSQEILTMYPEGPCKDAEKSHRQIQINFLPCTCPIGFEESKSSSSTVSCKCVCHHQLENIVANCDSSTHLIYRKGDFWMTPFNVSGTTSFFVFQYCPFDYCLPATVNVSINLKAQDGVDAQCNHNRSGILCSTCRPGLSLSLGSSRCIDCPRYWPAFTVTLTISALIAGIILASVVLVLNLTVAAGTLNAVVFYANVVAANKSILSAFQKRNILTVLLAWLNLDLGLDACYYKGLDTYAKTWLDFFFSFYINVLVVSVILVCKYSDKFAAFIGKRNPVATLATLILFSYAKLLQNIITVVSFAVLNYPDNSSTIVWRPDASIIYLNGKHIPLFMMALIVLVIGIMYTIVLFLWQWLLPLSGFKIFNWVQNTKISSFMDAYHAPYTPRNRYWTGLLLIARVILYTVSAVNVSGEPGINLLSVIVVVACLFILKFKLYKKWTINLLETAIYFNLLLLCTGKFYILLSNKESEDHIILESISASVVIFMFFCVLIHHVISNTPMKRCCRWVLNHFQSARRTIFIPSNLSSPLLQNEQEFTNNKYSSSPNPVTFSVVEFSRPAPSDEQLSNEEEESNLT